MSERSRAVLLETFAALVREGAGGWPEILTREAARLALPAQWHGPLSEAPPAAAVRVAHALEMGAPGMHAWSASWQLLHEEEPALQLAAAAAALLAGREELLVLAAPAGGASSGGSGALVDGDSCARMAVAGFDAETEIRLGNTVLPRRTVPRASWCWD
jgi:hypothetical protein